ncbi:tail fiber assembly protein [Providencia rettgeri]|nr:tail fiber assembly protein [Providencia rettgeri]
MKNKYSIEIQHAEFDKNGLAVKSGWAIVYNSNPVTREYTNASYDNVPLGSSIVAGTYLDAPELPTEPNIAIVRSEDDKSWIHVADYRGQAAYLIENGQQIEINSIGELPSTLTLLEPKTDFDKWNGKKWVTDVEAQKASLVAQAEQEKAQCLEIAEQNILMLERKAKLDMATDEEKARLKQWEIYSIKVSDIDTSTAPDIDWPEKP